MVRRREEVKGTDDSILNYATRAVALIAWWKLVIQIGSGKQGPVCAESVKMDVCIALGLRCECQDGYVRSSGCARRVSRSMCA